MVTGDIDDPQPATATNPQPATATNPQPATATNPQPTTTTNPRHKSNDNENGNRRYRQPATDDNDKLAIGDSGECATYSDSDRTGIRNPQSRIQACAESESQRQRVRNTVFDTNCIDFFSTHATKTKFATHAHDNNKSHFVTTDTIYNGNNIAQYKAQLSSISIRF